VKGNARHSDALGDAPGLQVGEMGGVDALSHLDGERECAGGFHRTLDDLLEEVELPRERRSPALAGDLRNGASEVQVDVVGAVFGDEHGDRFGYGLRVDAVELDAARRLGLVVPDESHRTLRALDQGAARNHLGDVETGSEFAAEPTERGVGDASHRSEHDRHRERERPDLQALLYALLGSGCHGHPSILSGKGKSDVTALTGRARVLADATARGLEIEMVVRPAADSAFEATGFERGTITPLGSSTTWPVFADVSMVGGRVAMGAGEAGYSTFVEADGLTAASGATGADITG
jgi:hypothetical protein